MPNFKEYADFDATGLTELVRNGDLAPIDLLESMIARYLEVNDRVNAVIHPMFDSARKAAQEAVPTGPFRGVPYLLKDLVSMTAGEPYECGSRFLRGYRASIDSETTIRVKAAGLLITGRTNTPEFGLTPFTEPRSRGPTRNPWNLERTPGGSSGGSAAAVAAGMVPMAGGGDGGGSIRIPASCCGLFGLKPSRGRVPTGPQHGEIWQGAVVEGVLTRSVRDSATMLDCLAGPDLGAPYWAPQPERPFREEVIRDPGKLRIAFTTHPLLGHRVERDCLDAVDDAAKLLESLGHQVEEAHPVVDRDIFSRAFVTMICGELAGDIADAEELIGRKATAAELEPVTRALALLGKQISSRDYVQAVRYLERASRNIVSFFEEWDLLLTPTVAAPPFPIGALQPSTGEQVFLKLLGRLGSGRAIGWMGLLEKAAAEVFDFIPWTPIFNITGQPAMSVPLYWSKEGLPIGIHLAGPPAGEGLLFRLAGQLEQARPWFHRRPQLPGPHGRE